MTIYGWLIIAFWLVFAAVWAVSAFRTKRTIRGGIVWWREIALRCAILIMVLVGLRFVGVRHAMRFVAINRSPVAGIIGVIFCALGVGLAIHARNHLGRNWGLPMSRKEAPDLITTGPYRTIRHPIYTGILVAMIGSAVGLSVFWVLPLLVAAPYFIYAAWREEQLMAGQFPGQYPAYQRRTKMLIPHIL